MARMIPATIDQGCASPGEREIFRRLKDDPGTSEWIVLHSLDVANHRKQVSGEIDFVIIIPSKGVLCLEVKACSHLRRQGGHWYYGSSHKPDPRGPFKQAAEAMHSLRERLSRRRPDLSRVVFWSAVIFPYVQFSTISEEWHPWQVIDSRGFRARPISKLVEEVLDDARNFLKECPGAPWFYFNSNEPYLEQCISIAETLRSDFEFFESSKSQAIKINEELKRYTEEQFIALDAMEENPRVFFAGPAGTGKTLLAIEAVRRGLAAGHRVLFLCFNRLLGKWLEEQTSVLCSGVVTRTLHRYMLEVSGSSSIEYGHDFWENDLPLLAVDKLLEKAGKEDFFDELVVDEAQDILRGKYLDILDLVLMGGLASGRWRLFGDFEKQSIYGASNLTFRSFFEKRGLNAPIYSLRVNCRNTPRVATLAQLLGGLEPGYSRILRPDDSLEPELYYFMNDYEQQQVLIKVFEKLYQEGYSGKDIVVLSPKADGACAVKVNTSPWKERLQPFEAMGARHIGYSSIHAFKGLEASCIVITDIDRISESAARAIFYIGVKRALHRLVILCRQSVKKEVIDILLKRPM
jgi:DNA polymerase III delta prime subunit